MLGRLAFIGVAQSAGFKLSEIKDLVGGIEDGDGLSHRIRSLCVRKLDEVEELRERTRDMKGGSRSRDAADARRRRNARSSLCRATP